MLNVFFCGSLSFPRLSGFTHGDMCNSNSFIFTVGGIPLYEYTGPQGFRKNPSGQRCFQIHAFLLVLIKIIGCVS